MEKEKPWYAVVGAFSSGALYPEEFQKRGYRGIHIQDVTEILAINVLPNPSPFAVHLTFDNNLEELVTELRKYPLSCLIPGSEGGVELADRLSERLGLKSNGTRLSEARRNKYLMIEALASKGIATAKQCAATRSQEIWDWATANQIHPIVVKPPKSAGADSVFFCREEREVIRAFDCIYETTNMLGIRNDFVLAQSFLQGTEYIVDTVSCEGQHFVTDVWRYHKIKKHGGDFVYDYMELLNSDAPEVSSLRDYVFTVLDALEIAYGPAHAEVMMTEDGPVIVEIGARLAGMSVDKVVRICRPPGQVELVVDAYVAPTAFFQKTKNPRADQAGAIAVYLVSDVDGIFVDDSPCDLFRELEGFSHLQLFIGRKDSLTKTKDLWTSPGYVGLVHNNPDVLSASYRRLREIEPGVWERTLRAPTNTQQL